MLTPQHPLNLAAELVVDLFAGGGGASTGIEAALGYPPHIAITHGADGHPLTKTAQVRMCGNSVCPPVAQAIVAANYAERQALRRAE